MSEGRRSIRRKPLADRTNTPLPDLFPSLKPKPSSDSQPPLSNLLTSTGSYAGEELRSEKRRQKNPSNDPPSTAQPSLLRVSDDVDHLDIKISKTFTRSSVDWNKKCKGKTVSVVAPSSCPPAGKFRNSEFQWDKIDGKQQDFIPLKASELPLTNKKKRPRYSEPIMNKHSVSQDFIDKQRAYFAEVDAFELPVEEASESELE